LRWSTESPVNSSRLRLTGSQSVRYLLLSAIKAAMTVHHQTYPDRHL
jgi:hypothetical protein